MLRLVRLLVLIDGLWAYDFFVSGSRWNRAQELPAQ